METADAKRESARPTEIPAAPGRNRPGVVFDLAALFILTVVSFGAGCLINVLRANPLPWRYESRAQTMASELAQVGEASPAPVATDDLSDLPHEIRLDEFQRFVAEHQGLVLDARPAVFYHEAHVPGALSLPRDAFAAEYPRVRPTLESSRNRPIAIYCSGADCPDSQLLTDALTKLGYRHLRIYTSGWEEWSQIGLPQEGASAQP